jgi:hypothetical protein
MHYKKSRLTLGKGFTQCYIQTAHDNFQNTSKCLPCGIFMYSEKKVDWQPNRSNWWATWCPICKCFFLWHGKSWEDYPVFSSAQGKSLVGWSAGCQFFRDGKGRNPRRFGESHIWRHGKVRYPKFVHQRVHFSLFNALLDRKNCFSLITQKLRPIIFSHFLHALSLLEVKNLKRREMVGDTIQI